MDVMYGRKRKVRATAAALMLGGQNHSALDKCSLKLQCKWQTSCCRGLLLVPLPTWSMAPTTSMAAAAAPLSPNACTSAQTRSHGENSGRWAGSQAGRQRLAAGGSSAEQAAAAAAGCNRRLVPFQASALDQTISVTPAPDQGNASPCRKQDATAADGQPRSVDART